MKKTILQVCAVLFSALLLTSPSLAVYDSTDITKDFTDPNFRAYVLRVYDRNGDGRIIKDEVAHVQALMVQRLHIQSLAGISQFTNLRELYCSDNQLRALDLSKNTKLTELWCDGNLLTDLDLSANTSLATLICADNQLERLDVSALASLDYLSCGRNQFSALSDIIGFTVDTSAPPDKDRYPRTLHYYPQNVPQAQWTNCYRDVSLDDWFFNAVKYASTQGAFYGEPDSASSRYQGDPRSMVQLAPHATMNRTELALCLYRMQGAPYEEMPIVIGAPSAVGQWMGNPFEDVHGSGEEKHAIVWGLDQKIISGVSDTQFAPYAKVSRQDFAVLLARYAAATGAALPTASGDMPFSDVDQAAPYAKPALAQCYAAGLMQGVDNERLDPWGPVTRAQAAAMLQRLALRGD